jgi:hypothetical protein
VGRGFGLHGHDITPENQIIIDKVDICLQHPFCEYRRLILAGTLNLKLKLWESTTMAAKISIFIFYLALNHEKKAFYRVNYALLFVIIATGLALTTHQVFECNLVSNFA